MKTDLGEGFPRPQLSDAHTSWCETSLQSSRVVSLICGLFLPSMMKRFSLFTYTTSVEPTVAEIPQWSPKPCRWAPAGSSRRSDACFICKHKQQLASSERCLNGTQFHGRIQRCTFLQPASVQSICAPTRFPAGMKNDRTDRYTATDTTTVDSSIHPPLST